MKNRPNSKAVVGEYPLRMVVNSKINKVAAKSLELVKPSWYKNFIFDLTDFLILVEQFQKLLTASDTTLFNQHIEWINELISCTEEIRSAFLCDPTILLERRTIDDEWPSQLDNLLTNSPSEGAIISNHDDLYNALNVMTNFWIEKVNIAGWDLFYLLIHAKEPSKDTDKRFDLIIDKK